MTQDHKQRRVRGWGQGARTPLFFVVTCFFFFFFCNNFEELQTVLFFEVELIINIALLTYFYPNKFETYLIPNHLLFDRHLFYSSNTTSTVVRNLTVLSSTADKIKRISNHFWIGGDMNLRETQRTSKLNVNSLGAQALLEGFHSNASITL